MKHFLLAVTAWMVAICATPPLSAYADSAISSTASSCKDLDLGLYFQDAEKNPEGSDDQTSTIPAKDYTVGGKYEFAVTDTGFFVEYIDGILTITAINYSENCALKISDILLEKSEENILDFIIEIDNDEPQADCICLYDIEASFDNVEPGHYTIRFNNYFTYEIEITENNPVLFNVSNPTSTVTEISIEGDELMRLESGRYLHILTDEAYSISIVSTDALPMINLTGEGESDIDLTSLESGIYAARLTTTAGRTATLLFRR